MTSPESEIALLKQKILEAEQQVEEQRRRAEEERRRGDERVEEERRRAEEERRRGDERVEEERRRGDERVKEERRRGDEQVEQGREKIKPTNFDQHLRYCHIYLWRPLRIQMDRKLGTKGTITTTKDKPCPTLLKPWTEFPDLQREIFESIYEYIPRDAEIFSSIQHLTELGKKICDRPLASEKDLEIYQRLAVEQPATEVISHLQHIKEARHAFNLGEGIIFENHANTLSDSNDEVRQSLQNLYISASGEGSNFSPKPRNADQICVRQQTDGTRTACLIVEYKPSHKLSVSNLQHGLSRADSGCMNLIEDVINRITIPTQSEENFVYKSEQLVAAALTQTYCYMIENGLEYSYLVTAEAFVFLWVKENDPHTLYYHLAVPSLEAEADKEIDILLHRTAVGLTLTFCLLALGSEPRGQSWRNHTFDTADRVTVDHDAILRGIPYVERVSPPSPGYTAETDGFYRSPYFLRSSRQTDTEETVETAQKVKKTCRPPDETVGENSHSTPSSSDETPHDGTPRIPGASGPEASRRRTGARQLRSDKLGADKTRSACHRQYCTQACLLGLVRKLPLDNTCPNINAHRAHGDGNHHALQRESLAKLMLRQLTDDPDNGCEPLGKQGARGALFRLTLELYGYTFVGKGTVIAFKAHLQHEGLVYQHLSQVQGELIPVYLGNISLVRPYFLDVGVRIIHMLLMSWAGEHAEEVFMPRMPSDVVMAIYRAVAKLRDYGVEHRDVRPPNVLWNSEIGNVVLVDFERSKILK